MATRKLAVEFYKPEILHRGKGIKVFGKQCHSPVEFREWWREIIVEEYTRHLREATCEK